jgi:hypothetical protein
MPRLALGTPVRVTSGLRQAQTGDWLRVAQEIFLQNCGGMLNATVPTESLMPYPRGQSALRLSLSYSDRAYTKNSLNVDRSWSPVQIYGFGACCSSRHPLMFCSIHFVKDRLMTDGRAFSGRSSLE